MHQSYKKLIFEFDVIPRSNSETGKKLNGYKEEKNREKKQIDKSYILN